MNSLVLSTKLTSRQKSCEKLKKRKIIRSFTPDMNPSSRRSHSVESSDLCKKDTFSFDQKTRKITAPLIGEVYLGRVGFNLMTPKDSNPVVYDKEPYKEISFSVPEAASNFLQESKTYLKKKRNYVLSLRKSIKELKVLKIPDEDMKNLDKILYKRAYEHPKARVFMRACKYGITDIVKGLIKESPFIVHSFDNTRMTGLH